MFYAITLPHGRHEIDDQGIYEEKPWSEEQKNYAAQVTRLDSDVGRLMSKLKDLDIDDNTLEPVSKRVLLDKRLRVCLRNSDYLKEVTDAKVPRRSSYRCLCGVQDGT